MELDRIVKIAQISSVLEVCGYVKPGNVHRNRDFDDMAFEDFLISAVVVGSIFKEAVSDNEVSLGKYIYKAVDETNNWVSTNTNLGIMMMCMPIACSAAISDSFEDLQKNIIKLMDSTTVDDACYLYDAINIAEAGGMGSQDDFDVNSESAKDELRKNNQNMYDVLKISASWDRLASELTSGMPVCFDLGYPSFYRFSKNNSLSVSCVLTFLTILSEIPDTLISRKYGDEVARDVSIKAKELLNEKEDFDVKLIEFDNYLFEKGYNPGTTADLTAASIMISYLKDEF